jgi:CP family cyanate transporter-like MFS transporter
MRAAITSLPPVYPELAHAGMSTATEAVLAAVPVLSFAVFSGSGATLARKFGEERVLGAALVLLAAGLGLRALAPGVLLFPGTIVASCAIALMNVLLPSLVKRRMPDRAGLLIGFYLMSLTAGAVLGAVIAVPVFTAAGSSDAAVRLTLGMWALPALAAGLVWLPQLRFRTLPAQDGLSVALPGDRPARYHPAPAVTLAGQPSGPEQDGHPTRAQAPVGRRGVRAMSRQPLAWQVAAFMGTQSLSYYATLSWFPTLLRDHGLSAIQAGDLLAVMNLGNAVTGLVVPVLAHRLRDQRALAVAAVSVIMAGLAGVGFGPPGAATAFMLLLGFGQGAAFGLCVFLFTARAADGPTAASLSGFAQATGYLVAIAGPLLIGLLHSVTGGWAASVWVLLAVGVAQLAAGLLAGRARTIAAESSVVS